MVSGLFAVPYNISITGTEDLGEDDNATITCTLSGLLYEPSVFRFGLVAFVGGSDAAAALLQNTSLYAKTVMYNNVSRTYVVSIVSPPIPIVRNMDSNNVICACVANTTVIYGNVKLNVSCKYMYEPKSKYISALMEKITHITMIYY